MASFSLGGRWILLKHLSKSLHGETRRHFPHAVRSITSLSDTVDDATHVKKTIRPFEEIPGPKKYPIIGSILRQQDPNPLEDQKQLVEQYGPIVTEDQGITRIVYIAEPDMVAEMHRNEGKFPERGYTMLLESLYCVDYDEVNSLMSL